uniref:Lipocalin n=1 Tax=Rhipicephalus appendiculatus TaxID=34631 RepID=A0A131YT49_RHIAP
MTILAVAVVMALLYTKLLALNFTRKIEDISMLCVANNLYMVGASTNLVDPKKVKCLRSQYITTHKRGCRRFVDFYKNFATEEYPWWSHLKYTISIYTWMKSGLHYFMINYAGAVLPVGIPTDYTVFYANEFCLITGNYSKNGERTICSYWVKAKNVEDRNKTCDSIFLQYCDRPQFILNSTTSGECRWPY